MGKLSWCLPIALLHVSVFAFTQGNSPVGDDQQMFQRLEMGEASSNPAQASELVKIAVRVNGSNDSRLVIVDGHGNTVTSYGNLGEKELVVIPPGTLAPGFYKYALIVEGRVVKKRKLQVIP
jgi:hypothetical protein